MRGWRSGRAVFLIAGLFLLAHLPAKAAEAIKVPVFLDRGVDGRQVRFTARSSCGELGTLSQTAELLNRPLLVVIDPSSWPPAELKRRVSELFGALVQARTRMPGLTVRIAVLSAGGIVMDLPAGAAARDGSSLDNLLRLIPTAEAGPQSDPAYSLDLTAALIGRVEDGGALDALLLAKDRQLPGQQAEYRQASAERRILEVCGRYGSALHGYLDGTGTLGEICAAAGGRVYGGADNPESVLAGILDGRKNAYTVELLKCADPARRGRFRLDMAASDSVGTVLAARSPAAFWHSPEGWAAPAQDAVRTALDNLLQAGGAVDSGQYAHALRLIASAARLDPWNPEALYLAARCSVGTGAVQDAAQILSRAIEFQSPPERVLVLYAEVMRRLGKSADGLEAIRVATAGTEPALAVRLAIAHLLQVTGKVDEAVAMYAAIGQSGQRDSRFLADYGCLLWSLGREQTAEEQIRAALEQDPRCVPAMLCSADIAVSRRNLAEALDLVSRAAVIQPENAEIHSKIGRIQTGAGRWQAALASFEKAAELAPASPDALLELAEARIRAGRGAEAVESIRGAIAADRSNAEVYRRSADLFAEAGSFSNAASLLEESATRFRDRAFDLYWGAAAFRERMGQFGQALLDYAAAERSAAPDRAAGVRKDLTGHLEYLALMRRETAARTGVESSPSGTVPAAKPVPDGPKALIAGGTVLISNLFGLAPQSLKQPGALGRLFSAVLDSIPQFDIRNRLSPVQTEIAQLFQDYEKLLGHMKGQNLLPAGFDRRKPQEVVFPVSTDRDTSAAARKFLSFFGVKFSWEGDQVRMSVAGNAVSQRRQSLLRALGVDVQARNLTELRFTVGDEEIPSGVDLGFLLGQSGGKSRSPSLLPAMILRRDTMKLYLALERCSAPLRAALLEAFSPKDLVRLTEQISVFGQFVEIRDGLPVLPGSQAAWESVLGASPRDRQVFLRKLMAQPKALGTYVALTAASPAVQRFLTSSPAAIQGLMALPDPASDPVAELRWGSVLARILRVLSADEHGLFIPIDERFAPAVSAAKTRETNPRPPAPRLDVAAQDLGGLLMKAGKPDFAAASAAASKLEFLRNLQESRPDILGAPVIQAVLRNPSHAAHCLDLIRPLDPPANLVVKYLAYCETLARQAGTGWNVNRTRTSQTLIVLLAGLRREGIIGAEASIGLFERALDSFNPPDEAGYLLGVSTFLTDMLVPPVARFMRMGEDDADLLLRALAGRKNTRPFLIEGAPYTANWTEQRYRLMKAAVEAQHISPLSHVLDVVKLSRQIRWNRDVPVEKLRQLAALLKEVPVPEQSQSGAGLKQLADELDALLAKWDPDASEPRLSAFSQRIAGVLDADLGMALLAHCYAYLASPHAPMPNDPDFVRKHDFYPRREPGAPPGWVAAALDKSGPKGMAVTGSLAGLGVQLHELETGLSGQTLGKRDWPRLVPALVSQVRSRAGSLLTERAQDYAALSMRLGRELVSMHASAQSPWIERCLSGLLNPARRGLLFASLERPGWAAAISPSELFLLGQAYLAGRNVLTPRTATRIGIGRFLDSAEAGAVPEFSSPTLDRLRGLVPPPGDQDGFAAEVEQYGTLLWRRLGSTTLSFRFCDPYEILAGEQPPQLLFERIGDLSLRLAEIGYSSGLPAVLAPLLGEMAVKSLTSDPSAAQIDGWPAVIGAIDALGSYNVHGWIQELLGAGEIERYQTGAEQVQEP